MLNPDHHLRRRRQSAVRRRALRRPGAETAVDAALRLDTAVMLVDDPVKRVDNMTMAWGLEARVPFLDHDLVELAASCPPELKLAQDGKGVLKEVGRRVIPYEVIDRPKGYFPVPGAQAPGGPGTSTWCATRCMPRRRSERGVVRPGRRRRAARRTRTASSRRCAATSSGSWACWSSGCSRTASDLGRTTADDRVHADGDRPATSTVASWWQAPDLALAGDEEGRRARLRLGPPGLRADLRGPSGLVGRAARRRPAGDATSASTSATRTCW